jgi:hypothetical protein
LLRSILSMRSSRPQVVVAVGEHGGEVDLDGAVKGDVVVVRDDDIVDVRRRVVVRAALNLHAVPVVFVKHSLGGLRAPVDLVEESDAAAGAIRLG